MPMFDADIFVDWSAANGLKPAKPSTDAVWVGDLVTQTGFQQETYHRSRFDDIEHVKNALLNQVKEGLVFLLALISPMDIHLDL